MNSAPGDIMSFLQACAMGNLARVEELLEKGVVGVIFSKGRVQIIKMEI